ncbi:MAG: type ISP restriction/modification enzyme, partial [Candidatus Odinarchaeota archaeon]
LERKFEWIENKINYNPKKEEYENCSKKLGKKLNEISELELKDLSNKIKRKRNDYFWDLQRIDTKDLSGFRSLQDDYVKFIRFAQWKIKNNNYGIIGFITNRSFIDKLIFRGMRSSLMRDFNKIYIIDMHGDARDGIPIYYKRIGIKKDENVFGIKPGVAISFFIRAEDHSKNQCDVYYCESWGSKDEKFEFFERNFDSIEFNHISKRLDYEFSIDHFNLRNKYMSFEYLIDIFEKNICGCITGNDDFISDISRSALESRIIDFFDGKINPHAKSVDYEKAKKKTSKEESIQKIVPWTYRGYDNRYICYNPYLLMRHGYSLLQYSLPSQNNITMIVERQYNTKNSIGSSVFITNSVFSHKCNEGASGAGGYAFPLKINESGNNDDYLNPKKAIHSNINQKWKTKLNYSDQISDNQIFSYIYGILFTPTYRERYYLGLMEDYPRIPFPDVLDTFLKMSNLGKKLIDLHLMKEDLDDTRFEMSLSTDYKIYNIRRNDKDENGNQISDSYDPDTQRIYFKKRTKSQIEAEKKGDLLDKLTWIGGITQEMWDFEIGGRQQLKEWLYTRQYSLVKKKNTIQRALNREELKYFLKMCDSIRRTIEILPILDNIYQKIDS